jgi:hypothetical protein
MITQILQKVTVFFLLMALVAFVYAHDHDEGGAPNNPVQDLYPFRFNNYYYNDNGGMVYTSASSFIMLHKYSLNYNQLGKTMPISFIGMMLNVQTLLELTV